MMNKWIKSWPAGTPLHMLNLWRDSSKSFLDHHEAAGDAGKLAGELGGDYGSIGLVAAAAMAEGTVGWKVGMQSNSGLLARSRPHMCM